MWSHARPASAGVRDTAAAVAFAAVSLVPALGPYGMVMGDLPTRDDDAWRVVLVLAQTLPLAVRRRLPGACLAVVGTTFALSQVLAYAPSPAGLGLLFALYSAGAYLRRGRVAVAVAAAVAFVALAVVLTALGSPERPWELATFGLVLAAAWGVGDLVRARAASARSRAELAARAAVLEERARLARELHDVVSHHVTGMVVQADAAAFLLPAEERAVRPQLAGIADAGRRALDDLRRLLDVLGAEEPSPGPPVGSIADLADAARGTGLDVELVEHGTPRGSDELRLTAYRVVQEALTNARKHAPGAAAWVSVRWTGPDARLAVATSAAQTPGVLPRIPSSGRGIHGLRARVEHLGGTLRAGPAEDGGFLLEASLPLDPARPPAPRAGDDRA
ncbi:MULTISPECIES: sensor histidine kinase [unclassified Isoptericola]|uniref:sensor histidine kinase n=1 Tax=unclassified Isoptericola TaxID=2623355 RepID=UPI003661F5C5